MSIINLALLETLPTETPQYVIEQLQERIDFFNTLPNDVFEHLKNSASILDFGPGEGISSMALATLFKDTEITGIEMDRKHLVGAWPHCNQFKNLQLYWGAFQSDHAKKIVDQDMIAPSLDELDLEAVQTLFTFAGLTRSDIFDEQSQLYKYTTQKAVFIIPKIWRLGLKSNSALYDAVSQLSEKNRISFEDWEQKDSIQGFKEIKTYPIQKKLTARGWLLWLSGIYNMSDVSFWDTLRDRRNEQPLYQLPDYDIEFEVVIAIK